MLRTLTLIALVACVEPQAWKPGSGSWRNDKTWYDGLAEMATYRAERVIYGEARKYEAVVYTNKERFDPNTTTKSSTDQGLEVFKHHWSERVPTPKYDYRFSTSLYAACDSLDAVKLTASTQEDCGASFKQIWRDGTSMRWFDSVYFPGAGNRNGTLPNARQVHFVDELPLLLRDFPFESRAEIALSLVRSQKDTHQVSFEPVAAKVRYVARETLDLPIGSVDAHHLRLEGRELAADYWMAADGRAPFLHALVKYEDPSGSRYELSQLVRTAYWKH